MPPGKRSGRSTCSVDHMLGSRSAGNGCDEMTPGRDGLDGHNNMVLVSGHFVTSLQGPLKSYVTVFSGNLTPMHSLVTLITRTVHLRKAFFREI